MKHVIFLGTWYAVLLFSPAAWSATLPTAEQLEAEAVVLNYFDALHQGDTDVIATLLDGPLLEKRQSLLNNPGYADRLRSLYQNAQFHVVGYSTLDADSVAIDTRIDLNDQETIESRFILIKDLNNPFRIHQEVPVE